MGIADNWKMFEKSYYIKLSSCREVLVLFFASI